MVLAGQPLQGLRVGELLILHHEAHGRAGLAAAEALVDAAGRLHVEGRRFLIVERTARPQAAPAALERHEIAYDVFDAGRVQNELYRLLRNHIRLFLLEIHFLGVGQVRHLNLTVVHDGRVLRATGLAPALHGVAPGLLRPQEQLGPIQEIPAVPDDGQDADDGAEETSLDDEKTAQDNEEQIFAEDQECILILHHYKLVYEYSLQIYEIFLTLDKANQNHYFCLH